MVLCPNTILDGIVVIPTNLTQRHWLYLVCVIIRITIFFIIFTFCKNKYIKLIILVTCFFTLLRLKKYAFVDDPRPWWSRQFTFWITVCVILSIIYSYYYPQLSYIYPLILFIGLFGGIIQRIFTPNLC